jgi:hypothetical protein
MEKDSLLLLFAVFTFLSSIFGIVGTYGSILEFSNFMTGHPIEEGVINLSVMEVLSLNFTNSSINFGPGNVTGGFQFATIDTLGNVSNGSWIPTTKRFVVKNVGNKELLVYLRSGKSSDQFIGGSNPSYNKTVSAISGGYVGCDDATIEDEGSNVEICSCFMTGKEISIDLELVIPSDSNIGLLEDLIILTYELGEVCDD